MPASAIAEIESKCVYRFLHWTLTPPLSQITLLFNNGSLLALKNGKLFEMKYCCEFTTIYLLPLICSWVTLLFFGILQCLAYFSLQYYSKREAELFSKDLFYKYREIALKIQLACKILEYLYIIHLASA